MKNTYEAWRKTPSGWTRIFNPQPDAFALMIAFCLAAIALVFVMSGCGGGSVISKAKIETEQARVVNYYNERDTAVRYPQSNAGTGFQSSFYDLSAQVWQNLTGNDTTVFRYIYRDIANERAYDSLYTGHSDYFGRLARALDDNFNYAKSGRK